MPLKAVLIVDDESVIRRMLAIALRREGIPVFQAADGLQALEQYQAHAEEIGLALLDVVMPRMDGPATLTALRELNPDLPCCLMTGHAGVYDLRELSDCVHAIFLKPFDLHELLPVVRRLLAHATTNPNQQIATVTG